MNQILSGSTWYKTNRHKHKLYRAFKLYVLSEYKKFLVFFRTEKKISALQSFTLTIFLVNQV